MVQADYLPIRRLIEYRAAEAARLRPCAIMGEASVRLAGAPAGPARSSSLSCNENESSPGSGISDNLADKAKKLGLPLRDYRSGTGE
jgi:hypothetical protein